MPKVRGASIVFGSIFGACGLALGALSPVTVLGQQRLDQSAADGFSLLDTSQVKDKADIIFSGYQALPDGGGILFVEMTDPVAVEVKRVGQLLEYTLVGARVPLKNNKNPLLLRDFNSAALSAVLVPDKKAVRLVVTLRSPVNPSHRMVARGQGAALEIVLPPASSRR